MKACKVSYIRSRAHVDERHRIIGVLHDWDFLNWMGSNHYLDEYEAKIRHQLKHEYDLKSLRMHIKGKGKGKGNKQSWTE